MEGLARVVLEIPSIEARGAAGRRAGAIVRLRGRAVALATGAASLKSLAVAELQLYLSVDELKGRQPVVRGEIGRASCRERVL